MDKVATSKVSKRGAITLPAELRHQFGIIEGSLVVAEARDDGILIRSAASLPVEIYTPERKAEFLLGSCIDATEYTAALAEVRAMGLDPDRIPHCKPPGV